MDGKVALGDVRHDNHPEEPYLPTTGTSSRRFPRNPKGEEREFVWAL